ncbi:hypothetical protein ACWCPQ_01875 [Nocardia sp. NPDC001965]
MSYRGLFPGIGCTEQAGTGIPGSHPARSGGRAVSFDQFRETARPARSGGRAMPNVVPSSDPHFTVYPESTVRQRFALPGALPVG